MRARSRTTKFFHIVLSQESAVSLRSQLVTQLTLHILNGALKPGDKLPSVRALARRLCVHHNTISAAYSELADNKLVESRRGSGVYVCSGEKQTEQLRELDQIIRSFLETARQKGYSLQAIRAAVNQWLSRQPPDHLLVVEPAKDLQEILVHELGRSLGCSVVAVGINEIESRPALLTGALAVSTAYHAVEVKNLLPSNSLFASISLQTGDEAAERLKRLPVGAMVGLVSIGPTVLEYAGVMIASLRGDQLMVRPLLFNQTAEWRSAARVADLLIADSSCYASVARWARKPVIELRLIPEKIIRYLRRSFKQ